MVHKTLQILKSLTHYYYITFLLVLRQSELIIIKLQIEFERIVDTFIEKKVGISENFLTTALANHLKENLQALYKSEKLILAGTGNNLVLKFDSAIRSDKVFWLDRSHNNLHENDFFDLIDAFVEYLNATCYTGITNYEFHYALYEKGSFYKKHLDQFKSSTSRAFSMIMYLNDNWQDEDGGELCIYHTNNVQTVTPTNSKCIFFRSSELEHEVLITHKPRMSITGWLKTNAV